MQTCTVGSHLYIRIPPLHLSINIMQKSSIKPKSNKDFQQDSLLYACKLKKLYIWKKNLSSLAWLLVMDQTILLLLHLFPVLFHPQCPLPLLKSKEVVWLKYSYLKTGYCFLPALRPPTFTILNFLCTRQIRLMLHLSLARKDLLLCNVFITVCHHHCINRALCAG